MKATFNISSNRLGYRTFLPADELAKLYAGHEIASHGKNHLDMPKQTPEVMQQEIEDDLNFLSNIAGYPVRGFAYPYAHTSPKVIDTLQSNQVYYGRVCTHTFDFRLPENFMMWQPTAKHQHDIDAIAEKYKDYKPWGGVISLCYIWGHGYEFDKDNNWQVMENFCMPDIHER